MKLFQDFKESREVLINKPIVFSCQECNDEYYTVGYEFLQELYIGMADLSKRYYNKVSVGELPYQFRERQLDSIILPTLSRMCDGAVLAEMPIERKFRTNGETSKSAGRLDYWCIYKDYSFVIEVKHSKDTYTNCRSTPSIIIKRWNVMTKYQLLTLQSELKNYIEPTKGIIRLGIQFINSESTQEYSDSLFKQYRNALPDILNRLCVDVSGTRARNPKPDFTGYWIPPLRMRKGVENYIYQNIPGFLLMAKIFEPISHKGSNNFAL